MKYTFLVSDESVNSYGFQVKTSGINLTNFKLNPIMLWMHERSNVIGRWENLREEDGKLYADAIFDIDDPLGKEIERKVKLGFLKATSIGIFVDEKVGDVAVRSTLYEISIVDIGSNSNALKLYQEEYQSLFLNNNKMELKEQLISVLSLESTADDESIIQAVTKLVEVSKDLENLQEDRIEEVLRLNLNEGRIGFGLKEEFKKLLKLDFERTKKIMENLPVRKSLYSQIKNRDQESFDKTTKLNWKLDDYRKYAPNELRDNPKLYRELLEKEGITKENN